MSTDDDIMMPSGNGDADCPKCRGRGVVPIEIDGWPGAGTQNCDCVFKRDLVANVKRVWQVLLSVDSVESSPLLGLTKQSLWITASNYALRRHLRYVAFRMGTQWDARVIADATLITAWLATAKDVKDPDVLTQREDGKRDRPSDDFLTLVDLAVPFDLLIIRLGVKAAKNREMPNVLAEAINERELLGLPTWVVDSPLKPLGPGHICFSDLVAEMLDGFKRVVLQEEAPPGHSDIAAYAPKAVSGSATGGLNVGDYGPKASAYREMPMAPAPTGHSPVAPPPADDDEFSAASLAAAAVNPTVTPPVDEVPDEAFDVEEVLGDYPTETDLRTNGTPSWLGKVALTMDARKAAQAKKKKGRR